LFIDYYKGQSPERVIILTMGAAHRI